jgi:hypothetical protein
MEVINLTPNTVNLSDEEGNILVTTLQPSGKVASVVVCQKVVKYVFGLPVFETFFGDVVGIPEPKEGVIYLVAEEVAQAAKRPDVVAPDNGPTAIRKNGKVVAIRSFKVFA